MTRTRLSLALVLVVALLGTPAAAHRPSTEPARAPAPADPASLHSTGAPGAVVGPVLVDLATVPVGDPEARPGLIRSHAQGEPADGAPDSARFASIVEDEAHFGTPPVPVTGPKSGRTPDAPGDILHWFQGMTDSGWFPPDPVLAVGPKYILEVINSGFSVYSKDGNLDRGYTDLETFFGPIIAILPGWSVNAFVFDPRVLYVPEYDRFVILALAADDINLTSYVFIAVSTTNNPLGGWNQYYFYDPVHTNDWIDYSGMSADSFGLYFTGQSFPWAGGFTSSIIYSVRPGILTGGSTASWIFWDLRWNEPGFPLVFEVQPAVPHSIAGGGETFFVNTFPSSGNKATVWQLTGDRGSFPTLVGNSATVQAYAEPGLAPQPAPGADDIEMFYSGVQNAAYNQRKVYFALNDAGSGNTGFYVSKVDVDTRAEDRNITYYFASDHYYYPNVNLYGSDPLNPLVGVAMSWSSNTQYASGAFKLYENFTVDASGEFWNVFSGSSTYNRYYLGRNRWGDYMGIARDWSCNTMWSVTEFAPSTNVWQTWLMEVAGNTAQPWYCRLIFDDGFERGAPTNWSLVQP